MFWFAIFFFLAFSAQKWAQIEACNVSLSSSSVDCSLRAYLITPDANNQTILTTAIYNTVYNTSTSNATVWTSVRRQSFKTYWNAVVNIIWDKITYVTQMDKINQIVVQLSKYSGNDCTFQAYFLNTQLQLGGCQWGTIADFVACGNSTANVSMPAFNATLPSTVCLVNVSGSTLPTSAAQSSSTASPSTSTTTGAISTSTSSSGGSSGSSNSSCKIITSSNWPVDCSERAYLITLDSNNQTILTTIIYDTVYNVNTSNATTWTSTRKQGFKSFWNAMVNIIWDNSASVSTGSKINQLVSLFTSYSVQDCSWQAYFFSTTLEFSGGCAWGSIGDFVACGNVSSNFTMPTSTVAPLCSINGNNSTLPVSNLNATQSPVGVSTTPSGSNNGGDSSTSSSSGGSSGGSSNSSCKIITSSSWPVDCAQRGNLILIDSNNQTILTTIIYDTVYNVNTSNSTVWTTGRKFGFKSFWNAMVNIIWDNSASASTGSKLNQIYDLLMSYSVQDCSWQAQFFSTSIVYGNGCDWGTIGDFLACGNVSTDYALPMTTDSTICPYGGHSSSEIDVGGKTVIVTGSGGGSGFTESINISLVTGFVNISFSGQTIEFNTATVPSINVSDSTINFSETTVDVANTMVSMNATDSTIPISETTASFSDSTVSASFSDSTVSASISDSTVSASISDSTVSASFSDSTSSSNWTSSSSKSTIPISDTTPSVNVTVFESSSTASTMNLSTILSDSTMSPPSTELAESSSNSPSGTMPPP